MFRGMYNEFAYIVPSGKYFSICVANAQNNRICQGGESFAKFCFYGLVHVSRRSACEFVFCLFRFCVQTPRTVRGTPFSVPMRPGVLFDECAEGSAAAPGAVFMVMYKITCDC